MLPYIPFRVRSKELAGSARIRRIVGNRVELMVTHHRQRCSRVMHPFDDLQYLSDLRPSIDEVANKDREARWMHEYIIRALIAKFLQESLQIIGVAVNVADQIVHGDKVAGIRKHYRRGVRSNPRSQLREEAGSNRHLRNNLVSTNCHAITLAAFTHLLPKWDPEMIYFRDFEPRKLKSAGIFNAAEYQSVGSILEDLNDWIRDENIEVVNIETVVLPNIHNWNEKGTSDPELITGGDVGSTWHQFFRVWYKAS